MGISISQENLEKLELLIGRQIDYTIIAKKKPFFDHTEDRINIDSKLLDKIYQEIVKENPLINFKKDISKKIGTDIYLTLKYSMSKESFAKLQKLYGKPIPYKIGNSVQKKIKLTVNEDLVEMMAIILGDGQLREKLNPPTYTVGISLNIDDYEYVNYVRDLMIKVFQFQVSESLAKNRKNATGEEKGLVLTVSGLSLIRELKALGLTPGDKVKNQVGIPLWFFDSDKFKITCLRGLIDTDGCISVMKKRKSMYISFINGSKPLVEGFWRLCNSLNIRSSNVHGPYKVVDPRSGYISHMYSVAIGAKEQVKKFLELIKPKKWDLRKKYIGTVLISLSDPNKSELIERQIKLDFPKITDRHYSKKYEEYLVSSCQKQGYTINKTTINRVITDALTIQVSQYSRDYAEYLKRTYEIYGRFLDIRKIIDEQGNIPIPAQITVTNYLKALFDEKSYKKYKDGYQKWYDNNTFIKTENFEIVYIMYKYREELCIDICRIIKNLSFFPNETQILNQLIYLINNQDLNGNISPELLEKSKNQNDIIDYEKIDNFLDEVKVLRFERLAYLLNNHEYSQFTRKFLMEHVKFVRKVITLSNSNKKINITQSAAEYKLLKGRPNVRKLLKVILSEIKNNVATEKNQEVNTNPNKKNQKKKNTVKKGRVNKGGGGYNFALNYENFFGPYEESDFDDDDSFLSPKVRETI